MVQLFVMINQKYHTGEPALLSGPRTKDLAVKGFLDRCGNADKKENKNIPHPAKLLTPQKNRPGV